MNDEIAEQPSLSRLEIRLFGEPIVLLGGRIVATPNRLATRHLLYYLILFPDKRIRRAHLAFLFWPDVEDHVALTRLRRSLHRLRRYLEELMGTAHWLHADKSSIELESDASLVADVWRLDSCCGRLLVMSDYSDTFFTELDLCCSMSRDALIKNHTAEWVDAARETYRIRRQQLLSSLVRIAQESGNLDRAVYWAQERATQGDLSEIAFQDLISLYIELGDMDAAWKSYQHLCGILQTRFGMEPDPSTVRIMKSACPHPTEAQSTIDPATRDAIEFPLPAVSIGTSHVNWNNNLSKLTSLMGSHRLVSLSGPGGVGKTRLSAEYSMFYSRANTSRVYYIDLGTYPTAQPIYATIARMFGGRANSLSECTDVVQAVLEGAPAILVLDHCDHVLSEASQIAECLVDLNNNFSSVIISRLGSLTESFGCLEITPMSLPVDYLSLSLDKLRTHSAIVLFAQRADPPIALHNLREDDIRTIASIVHHLGGLPLGIELAAAYTSILEIQDLYNALLSDSIRLINLDRLAAPHHGSLWRMLDWGHHALTPTAQSLLCIASLFPEGFKSEIALKIYGSLLDRGSIGFDDPADSTLDALAQQHLIRSYDCGCGRRLKLDPIVRDFSKTTELFALMERTLEEAFIQHYTHYLEDISAHLFDQGTTGPPCIEIHELANINEAMRVILCMRNGECALRLTLTAWRYWYSRGHHTHERGWVTNCLAFMNRHENQLGFWRMNSIAGVLCYGESMYSTALWHFGQAVDGFRNSHALIDLAECLQRQALAASAMGDLSLATRACSEAVSIRRSLADATGLADSLSILGSLLHSAGHSAQAIRVHTTCLVLLYKQEAPNYKKLSACLGMGTSSLRLGLLESASQSFLRAQSIASAIGSKAHLASIYDGLGQLARRRNDYYRAREHFGRSLALSSSTGEDYSTAVTYCNLGESCLEYGAHNEARLFLNRSLKLAEQNQHTQLVLYALSALCELAFSGLDQEVSPQTLMQLETMTPNDARPHLRAITYRAHGLVSLLSNHHERGLQCLFSSLRVCRDIHDPFEFSQTLRYTSMALAQAGDSELASISLDLRSSILDLIQNIDPISGLPPLLHGERLDATDITSISTAIPLTRWDRQIDELFDILAQRVFNNTATNSI